MEKGGVSDCMAVMDLRNTISRASTMTRVSFQQAPNVSGCPHTNSIACTAGAKSGTDGVSQKVALTSSAATGKSMDSCKVIADWEALVFEQRHPIVLAVMTGNDVVRDGTQEEE